MRYYIGLAGKISVQNNNCVIICCKLNMQQYQFCCYSSLFEVISEVQQTNSKKSYFYIYLKKIMIGSALNGLELNF